MKIKTLKNIFFTETIPRPRTYVYPTLIGTFVLVALYYNSRPAISGVIAALTLPKIVESKHAHGESNHTNRSAIQKHFLNYGLYIATSDIVSINDDFLSPEHRELLIGHCGDGPIFLWVPLKFRIPFYGYRVYEWCWTPPVSKADPT